jgi:UDP:flavonoid glycosyltransferase YjiC (YdhE family)
MSNFRRRRILFVAEGVTLAQVVRLAALAKQLARERYEVHFACNEFPPLVFEDFPGQRWPIATIDKEEALRKVERGTRPYEANVLASYVEAELTLFDRVQPDLVVGDFRLSLPISARVRRVPCATLINAYWSPYADRDGFPMPDHPIVSFIGVERALRYFPQALPAVLRHFAAPCNAVRARHGLPALRNLTDVLVDGDFTLYPDVEELCPTRDLPGNHRYLGPISWSPELPLPALPASFRGRPLAYVTLGSSGRVACLRAVLDAVRDLPLAALVATAGRASVEDAPPNALVVDFVAGDAAARAASFVVTNGGSASSYQALAAGRPVLGIASNMDQYLSMSAIERARAGVLVRAGGITARAVREAMLNLLESFELRRGAEAVARTFAAHDCHRAFARFLRDALPGERLEEHAQ